MFGNVPTTFGFFPKTLGIPTRNRQVLTNIRNSNAKSSCAQNTIGITTHTELMRKRTHNDCWVLVLKGTRSKKGSFCAKCWRPYLQHLKDDELGANLLAIIRKA